MTVKQQQLLLEYLGYSPGPLDGVSGVQTTAAVRLFQADNGLEVDGICGRQTEQMLKHNVAYDTLRKEQAIIDNSSDNSHDEIIVNAKPAGIYGSKYFSREEFRCQCDGKYCNGFPHEPTKALVDGCDYLREAAGGPLYIRDKGGSGLRCPKWNELKGGAARSNHLYGKAADLHPSNVTPQQLYNLADAYLGHSGELGLYSWGIHFAPEGTYSRFRG